MRSGLDIETEAVERLAGSKHSTVVLCCIDAVAFDSASNPSLGTIAVVDNSVSEPSPAHRQRAREIAAHAAVVADALRKCVCCRQGSAAICGDLPASLWAPIGACGGSVLHLIDSRLSECHWVSSFSECSQPETSGHHSKSRRRCCTGWSDGGWAAHIAASYEGSKKLECWRAVSAHTAQRRHSSLQFDLRLRERVTRGRGCTRWFTAEDMCLCPGESSPHRIRMTWRGCGPIWARSSTQFPSRDLACLVSLAGIHPRRPTIHAPITIDLTPEAARGFRSQSDGKRRRVAQATDRFAIRAVLAGWAGGWVAGCRASKQGMEGRYWAGRMAQRRLGAGALRLCTAQSWAASDGRGGCFGWCGRLAGSCCSALRRG